jgi:hypothetical protein
VLRTTNSREQRSRSKAYVYDVELASARDSPIAVAASAMYPASTEFSQCVILLQVETGWKAGQGFFTVEALLHDFSVASEVKGML